MFLINVGDWLIIRENYLGFEGINAAVAENVGVLYDMRVSLASAVRLETMQLLKYISCFFLEYLLFDLREIRPCNVQSNTQ